MYGYDYNYGYADTSSVSSLLGGVFALMGFVWLIMAAVSVLMIISQWKIYKKAGKAGWECLVPIYNIIVLLEIVELPMWYIALFFVPFANIYAMIKIFIELAHKFGKSTGFGVLTAFFSPIFLPILAFGKDNVYNGGNNQTITPNTNQYNPNNLANYQAPGQPMTYNPQINNFANPVQQPVSEINQPIEQQNVEPTTNIIPNITIPQPVEQTAPQPIEPVIPETTINVVPNVEVQPNVNEVVAPTIQTQQVNVEPPVITPVMENQNHPANNLNNMVPPMTGTATIVQPTQVINEEQTINNQINNPNNQNM